METKANYALIGAFVLAAFISAVAFIAWLSGSQFDQQFDEYEVIFDEAVRGLSQGGEVRYNGLRVGEVKRLTLDPADTNRVIALIEVDANTPVKRDSFAQLEPLGLTGLSYIQIFSGSDSSPLLETDGRDLPRIQGEPSRIDNILEGGDDVVTNATIALRQVNELLSDDAIADFQGILANVERITGKLADSDVDTEGVNDLFAAATQAARDLSTTLKTYQTVAQEASVFIDQDGRGVINRFETTLDTFDTTVTNYNELADEVEELSTDLRDAINRLSTSGLTDIEETTNSLRDLVGSLNRIATQLEQSPLQFIVGGERQVVEIPQ